MGILDKLWDETLAGPMPETGLGKLRKYNSFSATRSSPAPVDTNNVMITRSITILKSNSGLKNLSLEPGSPSSPSGSSNPGTPLSRDSREENRQHSYEKNQKVRLFTTG
ncbi:hypothetical protein V6N13_144167 [Hibiscus sabdariffa]